MKMLKKLFEFRKLSRRLVQSVSLLFWGIIRIAESSWTSK